MSEKDVGAIGHCRWLGCANQPVVRVQKESPKIGEFDLPLCHEHAKRSTGNRYERDTLGTVGGDSA